MAEKQRGNWVPKVRSQEELNKVLMDRFILARDGTIDEQVLAFRRRRAQQAAQPRRNMWAQ